MADFDAPGIPTEKSAPKTASKRNCPLCGRDNGRESPLPFSSQPWLLKECARCGFVYLENPVEYSALAEEFAWERTAAQERIRRDHLEPRVQRLSRGIKRFRRNFLRRDKLKSILENQVQPGRLLDIGCGRGATLAQVGGEFVPFGIEISRLLSAQAGVIASERGGFVVQADALSGLTKFDDGFFSVVVLSAFLEHENQPRSLLAGVFRVLRPGGRVVIKVPNYDSVNRRFRARKWCGFRFPDHVNYFTPRTLREMVEKEGFRRFKFTLWDRHPLSDNMWMIAEKPRSQPPLRRG